jgi:outer membrane protein assembly factor BamD (BamD/ComL family)
MKTANRHPKTRIGRVKLTSLRLESAALMLVFSLAGCAAIQEERKNPESERRTQPFERSNALFMAGNYDAAFKENQKVLAEGKGAPDVALFNMGLIDAYSLNPKKDYPKALGSFRALVKNYPRSPLAEQARVWIQVLEGHQKIAEERQKLLEEKRALSREREALSQEREKLKYTAEKSREVDIQVEKRRRQTLSK